MYKYWVPITYIYVGINYYLQYKSTKFICNKYKKI